MIKNNTDKDGIVDVYFSKYKDKATIGITLDGSNLVLEEIDKTKFNNKGDIITRDNIDPTAPKVALHFYDTESIDILLSQLENLRRIIKDRFNIARAC